MSDAEVTIDGLPEHYATSTPQAEDAADVAALLADHQRAAKGSAAVDPQAVLGQLVGIGSWTRRQVLVRDLDHHLLAWLSVHDRAGGRTLVELTVTPSLAEPEASALAGRLFACAERYAQDIATMRGLRATLLDSGAYADDPRQQRWLADAGYEQTRTWLQMTRPVTPEEASGLPGPREGVEIRPVDRHEDGLPVAQDLQAVHRVLEESFQDHFSSYRESFPEFVMRLREDPGHRWDHWWLATVETDDGPRPAGAVVSSVLRADADGVEGSYVDYIGVHRRARGRGVAKSLLRTVIADAARRGRNRVGLEVDADSPTGADGLYASMGWVTDYRTQSWHRDIGL
ncbi:GNAT family N-acetyltransferase [Phycicoccus endophyticus]|uniref:GNAT family N-acetyltransferase n=1 Tax=Phycicoccus endophyticus TaxID=1690220 RepID=A0A7G9R0A3_9MICO|nr:GNAT family N-acetyltransferase [Phycicoccus endophyticus]NHI20168.1 GNAT family N-acetyltransferase [Phycicoccus endophyticus]QNN49028.1 GNAT family N-acetyltransferase [Phycicoccus endophyticus]GGL44733.1 N-acetyltransferase [Phycicoccus endophyticus]